MFKGPDYTRGSDPGSAKMPDWLISVDPRLYGKKQCKSDGVSCFIFPGSTKKRELIEENEKTCCQLAFSAIK